MARIHQFKHDILGFRMVYFAGGDTSLPKWQWISTNDYPVALSISGIGVKHFCGFKDFCNSTSISTFQTLIKTFSSLNHKELRCQGYLIYRHMGQEIETEELPDDELNLSLKYYIYLTKDFLKPNWNLSSENIHI